jgi:hypothetical protein
LAGACKSNATRPVPVEIVLAIWSLGERSAPLTRSSASCVGFIDDSLWEVATKKPAGRRAEKTSSQ